MKVTLHLRATDTDTKQARLQSQRQFDGLLGLIKRYNIRLESMHRTITTTYDIEVTLAVDEATDLNPSINPVKEA